MTKYCLGAVLLGLVHTLALAQTRYISDEVSVNLRSGPGIEYRIEKILRSGDVVEVIERQEGWARVTGPDGQGGWLVDRMLVTEEPAVARARKFEAQAQSLETQKQNLTQELQSLRETSADAVRAVRENREYRERMLALESEVQALRNENEGLRGRHGGMKIGAAILVVGLLLGLILPLLRRRPSSSHWV